MSTQAKKRLVNALVSLAKSKGGYFGLSDRTGGARRRTSTTRKKRTGGVLVGGSQGGSLGMSNIRSMGGRKRRVGRPRKTGGVLVGGRKPRRKRTTGGASDVLAEWRDFLANFRAKHPRLSFVQARTQASKAWKDGKR